MDFIREFDIRLEKEYYYAGEMVMGMVVLKTSENFKLKCVKVNLRGKAHAEWKVILSGDKRSIRDEQHFIDERQVIWGEKNTDSTVPILPRGHHKFTFKFQLPESSLPCSFESQACYVRYYVKATIDIPYASSPQGIKYFTIIGPHIDCMDEQYLKPKMKEQRRSNLFSCCRGGFVSLRTVLERSAYVCNETLKMKAFIDNRSAESVRLKIKLVQICEFFIDRGVLGLNKEIQHVVMDYRGDYIAPNTYLNWESSNSFVIPVMPTTLSNVCRLIQIAYALKVGLENERLYEITTMQFPITIATVPFRIPNTKTMPDIKYETASGHVEGGMYIGPEFLLGQVYDGSTTTSTSANNEPLVLYRPVYACVAKNASSINRDQ